MAGWNRSPPMTGGATVHCRVRPDNAPEAILEIGEGREVQRMLIARELGLAG